MAQSKNIAGHQADRQSGANANHVSKGTVSLPAVPVKEWKEAEPIQLSDLNSTQPVQRFKHNILMARRLSQAALPAGAMYGVINESINALLANVRYFDTYENGPLDTVMYLPPGRSAPVYEEAVNLLNEIYHNAEAVLGTINAEVYDAIRPIVLQIRNYADQDATVYEQDAAQARTAMNDTFARIFRQGLFHNPYAVYPDEYITVANFILAKNAGILDMGMVKWWRSAGYPGFNAEIGISIGGYPWALAHVKWNNGVSPNDKNDDPFMYNFKTPEGNSFADAFSLITNDSVQIHLLGTCFPYVGATAVPWRRGETERWI
jgi:hypothetical protein